VIPFAAEFLLGLRFLRDLISQCFVAPLGNLPSRSFRDQFGVEHVHQPRSLASEPQSSAIEGTGERKPQKKSKVRARIEHVFGAQQTSPGGRIVRTIGLARAKAKIGLQNLAYNIRRLVTLERMATA
jgi:hypothetical protein